MAWKKKADIRGPRGWSVDTAKIDGNGMLVIGLDNGQVRGVGQVVGPQGLPGPNAVPADTAVAGYVATAGSSETQKALDDRYGSGFAESLVYTNQVPRARPATPPTRTVGKPVGLGFAVSSTGSGYSVGDELTVPGGTLFGSASSAVIRVSSVNAGGGVTAVTVLNAGAYTAAPASPASPTGGGGTGAALTILTSTSSATTVGRSGVRVPPTDTRFSVLGMPLSNINSSGYYGQSTQNGTHVVIEWQTDATAFDIRSIGLNTKATLFVDGVEMDGVGLNTDTSGTGYLWSLDFGGVRRMRSFKFFSVSTAFGGLNAQSGATVLGAPVSGRKFAYWIGDSYTFGTGAETMASQESVVAAEALGLDVLPDGVGGAGWMASTYGSATDRINVKLPALTRTPDVIVWDLGYNNFSSDLAAVAAAMDQAIARAKVLVPSAQHIGFGPATPQGATAQLTALRDTVKARFLANGVAFVDVSGFINAGNKGRYTLTSDGVHPTPLGHKYLGARKAIAARPFLSL